MNRLGMRDMLKDFKDFALRGNVFDLAVAVVIGAAFGKIVSSLVENIITPLIGAISGGIDFSGMHKKIGNADVTYGVFLQSIFDFLIVAFVIFMVIRLLAKFKRKEQPVVEEAVNEVDPKEALLVEIRDLLKEGKTL
jgi:large conductance mechanosensitive channel